VKNSTQQSLGLWICN